MNRANEARDMTKKLATLAEKYQCAIVLLGHMNKVAGNKAAYRGMGTIDSLRWQGASCWSAEWRRSEYKGGSPDKKQSGGVWAPESL